MNKTTLTVISVLLSATMLQIGLIGGYFYAQSKYNDAPIPLITQGELAELMERKHG